MLGHLELTGAVSIDMHRGLSSSPSIALLDLVAMGYPWHRISISAIAGACFGALNIVIVASRNIPMYVVTILKFRSGLFPSLTDDGFPDYRKNVDFVRLILGYAFWGPIISSSIIFCIFVVLVGCATDSVSQRILSTQSGVRPFEIQISCSPMHCVAFETLILI